MKIRCSNCGALAEASCECGVAYIPALEYAKMAVEQNPEKSDRVIAEETGVSRFTVAQARSAGGIKQPPGEPIERVGKDGKTYHYEPPQELQQSEPEPKPTKREHTDHKARVEAIYQKKCAKFRAKVERECQIKLDKWKKQYEKDWDRARLYMASPRGIITKEHDKLLMKALHPDHVAALGADTIKLHNDAMRVYSSYRHYIVKEDAIPYRPPFGTSTFAG